MLDQVVQDGEGLRGQLQAFLTAARPPRIRLGPDGGKVLWSGGSPHAVSPLKISRETPEFPHDSHGRPGYFASRMARESARYDPTATLPPHRAFVVHFSTTARRGRRFIGRVEHLAS